MYDNESLEFGALESNITEKNVVIGARHENLKKVEISQIILLRFIFWQKSNIPHPHSTHILPCLGGHTNIAQIFLPF